MVRAAVTGWLPVIAAGCAATQVGGLLAPEGAPVIAQLSVTLPAKPPLGVTVIVELPLDPAVTLAEDPLRANPEASVGLETWTGTGVVSIRLDEVPVTVTV